MPDQEPPTKLERDICIHIFTVSAAMVGVCLTVIGHGTQQGGRRER